MGCDVLCTEEKTLCEITQKRKESPHKQEVVKGSGRRGVVHHTAGGGLYCDDEQQREGCENFFIHALSMRRDAAGFHATSVRDRGRSSNFRLPYGGWGC